MDFVKKAAYVLTFAGLLSLQYGCDRVVTGKPEAINESSSQVPSESTTPKNDLIGETPSQLPPSDLPRQNSAQPAATDATDPAIENMLLTIQAVKSDDPARMLAHLTDIERATQELLSSAKRISPDSMSAAAIRLSKMKLEAADHLVNLPTATSEQIRAGTKMQLVALSNLTGLKDVAAAKRLESFSKSLATNPDPELRHQGQIVRFGFEIQNLQNGIVADPSSLVEATTQLVSDPQYRGRVEMVSIINAADTLHRMGYVEDAKRIEQAAFAAFSDSSDAQLRNESWNLLTSKSQSVENFLQSLKSALDGKPDASSILAAARNVLDEYPNPVTLEMIAGVIPDLEYRGHVETSRTLADLVHGTIASFASTGNSINASRSILSEHQRRTQWIGRKIEFDNLIDQNGQPLDWSSFDGKVVLIDFWATWCVPCLQEIPVMRKAFEELSSQGFAILSINMDSDPGALTQFMATERLPWPTYHGGSDGLQPIVERYGVSRFPLTMLTDKSGKVVYLHVRGSDIATKVKQLLNSSN